MHHFVGGQRKKRPDDHLLTIKQGEGESLRSYVKQFNREVLEVNKAENKVQLTTFKVGLRSKEFVVALVKSPPASMTDLLIKAQKYMNAEDALAAIEENGPWASKAGSPDNLKGQKRERKYHPSTHGRSK